VFNHFRLKVLGNQLTFEPYFFSLLTTEALGHMVLTADSAAFWSGGESTVFSASAAWSHLSDSGACDCCNSVGSTGF